VIFALAAFDVVIPVLPSETAVILGGVLAWQGRLHLAALVVVAAAGAITGDHMSYGLGRWTGRIGRPVDPGSKVARLRAWTAEQLDARGLPILLVARFIPGGRTASTFVTGRLRFPLPRFTAVTVVAGVLWALFGTALGYVGGTTFHENTLLATGLGVAVGASLAIGVERLLAWRARRAARAADRLDVAVEDAEDLAA